MSCLCLHSTLCTLQLACLPDFIWHDHVLLQGQTPIFLTVKYTEHAYIVSKGVFAAAALMKVHMTA